MTTRRIFCTALLLCASFASAQNNTVRLVVPFATGGPTDIAARVIAPLLSEAMGKTVIVDNRVGATGAIGAEFVARAPADGNTILFGTSSIMGANPALVQKLPYDPIRDFAAVSTVATI